MFLEESGMELPELALTFDLEEDKIAASSPAIVQIDAIRWGHHVNYVSAIPWVLA
jgi:hypothetical protein